PLPSLRHERRGAAAGAGGAVPGRGRGGRGDRIQQNTFTRWCNEHLKCVQKRVGNLQTDLGDGLRLIALLEVLSQKKLGRRYNARPTFRQMQLENVSVALDFLERENIKLTLWRTHRDPIETLWRTHRDPIENP
uniref:Calponin-homology (CH) domain-containing protein n=1 Tax=Amazona collaria TaxID=241587 RepID=A0A8B9IT63_9PSIT